MARQVVVGGLGGAPDLRPSVLRVDPLVAGAVFGHENPKRFFFSLALFV